MAVFYPTREIKRMLATSLREIFAADADFPYNKSDIAQSGILITTRYSTPSIENKIPQILVSTASYSASQDTIGSNYWDTVAGSTSGTQVRRKFTCVVPFQTTLEVLSTEKAECEIISDKLFHYIHQRYYEVFTELGYNFNSIVVNEPTPKQQYPQYSFVSTITLVGNLRLDWIIGPSPEQEAILNHIKITLENETNEP